MTLDLDNMTQTEFDKLMAKIKDRNQNLFQFIIDFLDDKVTPEEVYDFLKMERSYQVNYIKRGHSMNELDLSNTQALIFAVILIGFLIYLNHRDRKKSAQLERENRKLGESPSESLSPDYGRYIQLAGINKQGAIK